MYIAGPFHGFSGVTDPAEALRGDPNAWCAIPRSDLLREILSAGESPCFPNPLTGERFRARTLTIRNGAEGGDSRFISNPDSPALRGAANVVTPGLDHDALRCARASASVFIPFLSRPTACCPPGEDHDDDGFRGSTYGGPDCDDIDPGIHPAARDIPGDGIDQDCNGCDLSPAGGRDGEIPMALIPPGY